MRTITNTVRNYFFPRPTIADALSGFTKAIDTLEAVVEDTQQDIDYTAIEIDRLCLREQELRKQRSRANALIANISKVIS